MLTRVPDLSLSDSCCLKCLKANSSILWMKDSGMGWTGSCGCQKGCKSKRQHQTTWDIRVHKKSDTTCSCEIYTTITVLQTPDSARHMCSHIAYIQNIHTEDVNTSNVYCLLYTLVSMVWGLTQTGNACISSAHSYHMCCTGCQFQPCLKTWNPANCEIGPVVAWTTAPTHTTIGELNVCVKV